MELSENEFKEIYDLVKKGFTENSGLNILDFEKMKSIAINHGYNIDEKLNIINKTTHRCIHKNKMFTDAGCFCINCNTILSTRK